MSIIVISMNTMIVVIIMRIRTSIIIMNTMIVVLIMRITTSIITIIINMITMVVVIIMRIMTIVSLFRALCSVSESRRRRTEDRLQQCAERLCSGRGVAVTWRGHPCREYGVSRVLERFIGIYRVSQGF